MTRLERLEELRGFVLSEISRPIGADDSALTEEGADILALIDREIASLNAPDSTVDSTRASDVQAAIEFVEEWQENVENMMLDHVPELDTILAALQSIQPKPCDAKLAMRPKGISETWEGHVANCPACNKFISETDSARFCKHCGQAVNWNMTEQSSQPKPQVVCDVCNGAGIILIDDCYSKTGKRNSFCPKCHG